MSKRKRALSQSEIDELELDEVIEMGDQSKYEPGAPIETRCACTTIDSENGYPIVPRIVYCPTHAAAPDLLKALKVLVCGGDEADRARRLGVHIDCVRNARAAIVKAEQKATT